MIFESITEAVKWAMTIVTSADKAYTLLREEGYEWTRREIREAWRTVGEKEYWSTVLETWGVERKPPRAWMMEGPRGMTSEYQYRFRYVLEDKETGERKEMFASFRTDSPVSFQEAWEEISGDIVAYSVAEGARLIEWGPAGILRRG